MITPLLSHTNLIKAPYLINLNPTIPISTDLCLKVLALSDAPVLFSLVDHNREHLREWLPWVDGTRALADTKQFLESCTQQYQSGSAIHYGVRVGGQLAGVVGFHGFDRLNKVTSLGYWLAREYCGKGHMVKCVGHSIEEAFRIEGMNRLYIRCATGNQRSSSIPKKLGLTHEGTQRQAEFLYDHFVDLDVYSVLANEWDASILTRI